MSVQPLNLPNLRVGRLVRDAISRGWANADLGAATTLLAATISLVFAYLMTYSAGGTQSVFPHLFYVPVLIVALRWGALAGGITGIIAGILCGPFMPLNVEAGAAQEFGKWLTRLGFFAGIGALSGGIMQQRNRRHERVERLHRDAIKAFVRTVDAKSPYTARHSERVAHFAGLAGAALGMPKAKCEELYWAGLVHDIGKLWIPDAILNMPGTLTEAEWAKIREHPVRSEQFLGDVEEFHPYRASARSHHERYDGTGYPDGLAGEEIPLEARILAVADAFEAMTVDRPYRPALSVAEAIDEIQHNAGTQFDPIIANAFARALHHQQPMPQVRPNTAWTKIPALNWPTRT